MSEREPAPVTIDDVVFEHMGGGGVVLRESGNSDRYVFAAEPYLAEDVVDVDPDLEDRR